MSLKRLRVLKDPRSRKAVRSEIENTEDIPLDDIMRNLQDFEGFDLAIWIEYFAIHMLYPFSIPYVSLFKGNLMLKKFLFLETSSTALIFIIIPSMFLWLMTFLYLADVQAMEAYCITWELIAIPWLYQALHKGAIATKYAMIKPEDLQLITSDRVSYEDFVPFQGRLQVVSGWRYPTREVLREQAKASLISSKREIESENLNDIAAMLFTIQEDVAEETLKLKGFENTMFLFLMALKFVIPILSRLAVGGTQSDQCSSAFPSEPTNGHSHELPLAVMILVVINTAFFFSLPVMVFSTSLHDVYRRLKATYIISDLIRHGKQSLAVKTEAVVQNQEECEIDFGSDEVTRVNCEEALVSNPLIYSMKMSESAKADMREFMRSLNEEEEGGGQVSAIELERVTENREAEEADGGDRAFLLLESMESFVKKTPEDPEEQGGRQEEQQQQQQQQQQNGFRRSSFVDLSSNKAVHSKAYFTYIRDWAILRVMNQNYGHPYKVRLNYYLGFSLSIVLLFFLYNLVKILILSLRGESTNSFENSAAVQILTDLVIFSLLVLFVTQKGAELNELILEDMCHCEIYRLFAFDQLEFNQGGQNDKLKEVEIAIHRLESLRDVQNYTILGVEASYLFLNSLVTMFGGIILFVINQLLGIGDF